MPIRPVLVQSNQEGIADRPGLRGLHEKKVLVRSITGDHYPNQVWALGHWRKRSKKKTGDELRDG
jgi:hypothetical protein